MYREISQQPQTWQVQLDQLPSQLNDLVSRSWFRRDSCIDLVGVGSSYNAAHIAAAGRPTVKTCPQKSTAYRPVGDAMVAISQSGRSTDTIAAVESARRRGLRVIGVTATPGSRLCELSDATLLLTLPEERAIAATASMTG